MISQVYKQRGKRGRTTKIIRYKWRYRVSGERIRITASGDMLIGLADTSPHSKLHVKGAINVFKTASNNG